MGDSARLIIAAAVISVIAGLVAAVRLAMSADGVRRARAREVAAAVAQYGLLFGFAAVAAAISAHGLFGFARASMGLRGPWPYLLWAALDGTAGLCAVLLMRRAARGESAVAPRLAVWGLVAASASFNWTHAPGHPGARPAFALMPVIAAMLFEFSLRETRHLARDAGRRLTGLGWLRPAERIRAWFMLSADATMSAEMATRRVRVDRAAQRLHLLRQTLAARERNTGRARLAARRLRRAERRAQAALVRVRFTDPGIGAEVLRQLQVLTLASTLAKLDYTTSEHAQAVLASLIAAGQPGAPASGGAGLASMTRWPGIISDAATAGCPAAALGNGAAPVDPARLASAGGGCDLLGMSCPAGVRVPPAMSLDPRASGHGGTSLIDAAARIVADMRTGGGCLSQAELARRLRADGYSIANGRLRWLSAVSGLQPDTDAR